MTGGIENTADLDTRLLIKHNMVLFYSILAVFQYLCSEKTHQNEWFKTPASGLRKTLHSKGNTFILLTPLADNLLI